MPSIPNIDWAKVLGSKAFENVSNVAGNALVARGNAGASDRANASNNANTAASLMERLLADEQTRRHNAAVGAADASPLGANENFAAKQAIIQQVLGGARNFSITPSDPDVAAAMPAMSGGLRLPENGLSAESLKHYGPEATAGAIAHRSKMISNIDPTAPTPDFTTMGYLPDIDNKFGASARSFAGDRLASTTGSDDVRRAQIMQALDRDLSGAAQPQEPTPWWKKALKIAATVAPIAAIPFTFGASAAISPAAMAAIGLGSGAAGGLANRPTRRQDPWSGVTFGG